MKRGLSSNSFFRENPNTIENLFTAFYGFQSGHLLVHVREARGFSKTSLLYQLDCEKQIFESQAINTKETSEWTQECKFEVKSNRSELFIIVYYMKKRKGSKGEVGRMSLNVKDFASGALIKGWHTITKKGKPQGEIFVMLQYMSEIELNKDYKIVKQNFRHLMDIVESQDLVIFSALGTIYDSEDLAKTATRIFNADGQALRLLVQLLYRDLKKTHSKDTLFREDSLATKTARNYFLIVSSDYLKAILYPLVSKIHSSAWALEIDPRRNSLLHKFDLSANINRFSQLIQELIDRIASSPDSLPLNVRKFFNLFRQLIKQVFPDVDIQIISSSMFLRFLCPLIVSPATTGVIDIELVDDERRILIYVSKVMQYLANGCSEFRDAHFAPFNQLLVSNQSKILKFCESICTIPTVSIPDSNRRKYTEEDKVKGLAVIFGQIRLNLEALEQAIPKDPRMKEPQVAATTQQHWEFIKQILAEQSQS